MKKNEKELMEALFGLFKENELTPIDFKVLVFMYSVSKRNNNNLDGLQVWLVERLNISERNLRKSLKHLEEMGFITVDKTGTGLYKINKDKIGRYYNPKEW